MKRTTSKSDVESSHYPTWYQTHELIISTYLNLSNKVAKSRIQAKQLAKECNVNQSTIYAHFKGGIADIEKEILLSNIAGFGERCKHFLSLTSPSREELLHLFFPNLPYPFRNMNYELLKDSYLYLDYILTEEHIMSSINSLSSSIVAQYMAEQYNTASGILMLSYTIITDPDMDEENYLIRMKLIIESLHLLVKRRDNILALSTSNASEN